MLNNSLEERKRVKKNNIFMQYIKMIKLGFVFKFNVLLEVAERIKKKTYKNRKGSTACD